jgi:hypothetical protein
MVEKAITTGTGLVAYDLQAPAKNLYPVNTPIIKSLPRVSGGTGVATNWKQVSAIIGSGFDNTPWVPEGQRAGQMAIRLRQQGGQLCHDRRGGSGDLRSDLGGVGFEDVRAKMTMRLLQKMMLKEEAAVLFGNNDHLASAPRPPRRWRRRLRRHAAGAHLFGDRRRAHDGRPRNSSLAGGVARQATVTGADGKTFTVNGGSRSSRGGHSGRHARPDAQLSVTAIQGAAGYAWLSARPARRSSRRSPRSTRPPSRLRCRHRPDGGLDHAFDSRQPGRPSTVCSRPLSRRLGAYVNLLATGTAGTGTVLTASGKGSVNEIDQMMQTMWDNNPMLGFRALREQPGAAEHHHQGAFERLGAAAQLFPAIRRAGEYMLTAGGTIEFYYNPYLNKKIPIRVHPNLGRRHDPRLGRGSAGSVSVE